MIKHSLHAQHEFQSKIIINSCAKPNLSKMPNYYGDKNYKFFHSFTRLSSIAPCSAITFHLLCFFFVTNSLFLFCYNPLLIFSLLFQLSRYYKPYTKKVSKRLIATTIAIAKLGNVATNLYCLYYSETVIQYNSFKMLDIWTKTLEIFSKK